MDGYCRKHEVNEVLLKDEGWVCPFCFWDFLIKTSLPIEELLILIDRSQENYWKTGEINEIFILESFIKESLNRELTLQEAAEKVIREKSVASLF